MAKDTISIGFEDKIWKAADVLRGNLNASEYEGVVLGLIFLKYISDRFETKYHALPTKPLSLPRRTSLTARRPCSPTSGASNWLPTMPTINGSRPAANSYGRTPTKSAPEKALSVFF